MGIWHLTKSSKSLFQLSSKKRKTYFLYFSSDFEKSLWIEQIKSAQNAIPKNFSILKTKLQSDISSFDKFEAILNQCSNWIWIFHNNSFWNNGVDSFPGVGYQSWIVLVAFFQIRAPSEWRLDCFSWKDSGNHLSSISDNEQDNTTVLFLN